MIPVTRLDGQQVVINGDLVERIEAIPDTIISLTSGRKLIVRETVGELLRMLAANRRARAAAERPRMSAAAMLTPEAA